LVRDSGEGGPVLHGLVQGGALVGCYERGAVGPVLR
jgi:hypothetical protein